MTLLRYGLAQKSIRAFCNILWRNPGEGDGTPLQFSCLENPMEGGAWWAAVHGVAKSRTRLSDFTLTFHFHALEKEMATHSSVLAWRIPGTGEPGGLPSMGSHRVGHDWGHLAAAAWRNPNELFGPPNTRDPRNENKRFHSRFSNFFRLISFPGTYLDTDINSSWPKWMDLNVLFHTIH